MKPPPGRHATESIYDEDTGKMYLMEKMLGQDPQDLADMGETLQHIPPEQRDKKVDADFFNRFEDDCDEDDMKPR
ncbi:hypothetical protein CVIRNUC_006697 [Coccomyxa viridis]|uniref:Uncharacterized protein n=1 Tax=Coccomyxa viridis TaxID=1274662 RepID=A0AAV1I815_9CHLO|nr:hypothetical protein [Icmadophila ericetorum]CAK0783498.1 hypothetical protein CVIRNUC_006697 [Coccomyxa viridis]